MVKTLVDDYLFTHNQIEKEQLKKGKFINNLPLRSFQTGDDNMILLKEYFLKNDFIYISKHPRFAPYPVHSHHFLELNYMYSGESTQLINGNKEVLKKGEILLLDKGSAHSIETLNENDILINIIFPNDKVDINWLANLNHKDNILFNFLAQTMVDRSKKEYLIFRCATNDHVQMILQQMIDKYFTEATFANDIISLYIPILFTELIADSDYDYYQEKKDKTNHQVVIDTLKLIDSDYRTLTLDSCAKNLGYNKNYLSNIIKKKTSLTFSELLTKRRMEQAKVLLENTQIPISEIVEMIGLKNRNHFYKQFKKTYGQLPSYFRQ